MCGMSGGGGERTDSATIRFFLLGIYHRDKTLQAISYTFEEVIY